MKQHYFVLIFATLLLIHFCSVVAAETDEQIQNRLEQAMNIEKLKSIKKEFELTRDIVKLQNECNELGYSCDGNGAIRPLEPNLSSENPPNHYTNYLPELTLLGVVGGKARFSSGETIKDVGVGEVINGYDITQITAERVILKHPQTNQKLEYQVYLDGQGGERP